jgi:hypothetical protein
VDGAATSDSLCTHRGSAFTVSGTQDTTGLAPLHLSTSTHVDEDLPPRTEAILEQGDWLTEFLDRCDLMAG